MAINSTFYICLCPKLCLWLGRGGRVTALGKRLGIAGMGLVRILGWCCSPAGKTWQHPTFTGSLVPPRWSWLSQDGIFGDTSRQPLPRGWMCGREKCREPAGLCPLCHTCAGQTWEHKQKGSSSQALWSCMYPQLCSSSGVFGLTAIIDIFWLFFLCLFGDGVFLCCWLVGFFCLFGFCGFVFFIYFGPSQNMI